jgi:aspartyl-tRNA(Asn)/glutamyl-tRNA(Gln) amidotransferase subunit A
MKGEGIDKEVHEAFLQSFDTFKKMGYEIVEIDFKLIKYALAVYYIVMPAELSTGLERLDGIRYGYHTKEATNILDFYSKTRGEGFGKESRRRILLGTEALSKDGLYYRKATILRNEITKEIDKAFESVDFYITPTAPTLPFKIGEKMTDPVAMYYSDVFSAPANLSGCPAIALPTGFTPEGLPTSVQVTAPRWEDDNLFTLGKEFEHVRLAK